MGRLIHITAIAILLLSVTIERRCGKHVRCKSLKLGRARACIDALLDGTIKAAGQLSLAPLFALFVLSARTGTHLLDSIFVLRLILLIFPA